MSNRGVRNLDEEGKERLEDTAEELGLTASRRHTFLCCDATKPKCCGR